MSCVGLGHHYIDTLLSSMNFPCLPTQHRTKVVVPLSECYFLLQAYSKDCNLTPELNTSKTNGFISGLTPWD